MMQKLEPRSVGLKPTKIRHVDRVNTTAMLITATATQFLVGETINSGSNSNRQILEMLFDRKTVSAFFILKCKVGTVSQCILQLSTLLEVW